MDDAQSIVGVMSFLVRAVGRYRIEGVRHRDDACEDRNLIPLEAVGISTTVEGLVMQLDSGQHFTQLLDRAEDVCPLGSVRLHDLEFFRSKGAWFFQDAVFDTDL